MNDVVAFYTSSLISDTGINLKECYQLHEIPLDLLQVN